ERLKTAEYAEGQTETRTLASSAVFSLVRALPRIAPAPSHPLLLTCMRKVVLLYNPIAGKNRERRRADVEAAAQVLRAAGIKAETVATRAPGSAGAQAREAVAEGYDTVLACGGDGT